MSRIRVLHVVAGLDIGATFGGAERSGLELARALDRQTFDIAVCAFWRCDTEAERDWQRVLAAEGIALSFATESGARRNTADFAAGARRIAGVCSADPVDIIHAHHEGGALAGLSAKWAGGARAVLRTVHVPLAYEWGRGMVAAAFRAIFSRMAFPLALDAEVAVSPDFRARLQRRWASRIMRREVRMIYNSRPLTIHPVDEVRLRHASACRIGSIGRLTEQKGHRTLIEAMPRVRARLPQAQLVLIGDGELRDDLARLARALEVESAVRFLGQRQDAAALLTALDAFALPSLWEGIPTVLLESIAAGVPVIASDVPGNRDVIEDGVSGWLIPPHDAEALANALVTALLDREAAIRFARTAQVRLGEFAMPAIAAQYEALYRDLVAS